MAFIVAHIVMRWKYVRVNARLLLVLAALSAAILISVGGRLDSLGLAASRALYLPALLTVMTLLRVAALRSDIVGTAARFAVDQPPSRRFFLLAGGSHIFGILLNLGGLQLLLGIAMAVRVRNTPSPAIAEMQARRITNAVLRGFGATILWSPVGLAINLLIPIMPSLDYVSYLPYGLFSAVVFIALGWIFDRLEPAPRRRFVPAPHGGAGLAMTALLALLLAITGISALAEASMGVPMRTAILIVIPTMAVIWVFLTEPSPFAPNLKSLARDGFRALPESTNEICLIGSSAFLGLTLVELLPADQLRVLVEQIAVGPGTIACGIIVLMTVLGQIGLSPMITALLCTGAVVAAGIDMPETMLMLAVMCGWSGSMLLSPFASTLAVAMGMTGKLSREVGLHWNGPFVLAYYAVVIAALLIANTFF
ncbi:hypothetical protein HKM20_03835 [Pelagibacterium halotolerans]|nr:hypothetical protein HKM20_03835 [Pelagibacterium halotolerans]